MQIDVGFGDTVVPDAAFADYPTILDHAQPRLRAYPKETVIAEKFEAMVKLGQLNSRLKDFFDLWLLSRQFEFDGRLLSEAITRTFENRKTTMSALPIALTAAFANDPIKQSKHPTNPILASLVSLVAGVFRSLNFIPTQVMVRSEQWWRRLLANQQQLGTARYSRAKSAT
jgi:hypothetical protein